MVTGTVQGVGFRPFVYGLALRLGLGGFVRNRFGDVLIEVEGTRAMLDAFMVELARSAPPRAMIGSVACEERESVGADRFRIETSDESVQAAAVVISPDLATCDDCLRELFDHADRRYRYPFINCTQCGPRLTIIERAPYDRQRTTMARFTQCDACQHEYTDPSSRRFHAQPNGCAACGPRLRARDARGVLDGDPLARTVEALRAGRIVALKGIGGYHLACAAACADAVRELRRRKQRDEKPLAVMVGSLEAARRLCVLSAEEEALLRSPAHPIVLVRRRPLAQVAEEVAPGSASLGLMLAYAPLHHLLLHDLGDMPLVMTSGNRSDEPIACSDKDALERLSAVADLFLAHDRAIHLRCEDSVVRVLAGRPTLLRRARGESPRPFSLPLACAAPLLALGGHLKATFALGRDTMAILSPHLGDLDDFCAYRGYLDCIAQFERLFAIRPAALVHDLHPEYASTRHALERAAAEGLPCVAVQHHQAHVAACMVEHGLNEPVIGVAFDGTGYGADGTLWGGEFLVGDYREFRRAAHLRPVALPGGERAIREPWRMAAAHLRDAGIESDHRPDERLRIVHAMIERNVCAPKTTSMGRLFDAVASLAGVRDRVAFEGQAAMQLEELAAELDEDGAYPFGLSEALVIDTRPIIQAAWQDRTRGVPAPRIARRFHSCVVEIIASVCSRLRQQTAIEAVVLSGGVFMNAIVAGEAQGLLRRRGFRVHAHGRVPPNDGGLCLGQLAIAAARGV